MDELPVAPRSRQAPRRRIFRNRHHPDAALSRKEGQIHRFLMGRAQGDDALASVTLAEIARATDTDIEHVRISLRHLERLTCIRRVQKGGGRGKPNTWRVPWCWRKTSWDRWDARKQRDSETPRTQNREGVSLSCSRQSQEGSAVQPGVEALEVGLSVLEKGVETWNAYVGGAELRTPSGRQVDVHHPRLPPQPKLLPFRVTEADLATREGVAGLYARLVTAGWIVSSEWMREILFGIVARARRVAGNVCAFVAGCVRKRLWKHVSEGNREEARAEIQALAGETGRLEGVPAPRWERSSRKERTVFTGRGGGRITIVPRLEKPTEKSAADLMGQALSQLSAMVIDKEQGMETTTELFEEAEAQGLDRDEAGKMLEMGRVAYCLLVGDGLGMKETVGRLKVLGYDQHESVVKEWAAKFAGINGSLDAWRRCTDRLSSRDVHAPVASRFALDRQKKAEAKAERSDAPTILYPVFGEKL